MGISVVAKTATVGFGIVVAAVVGANAATAASLAGLKDGDTIVMIDTEQKKVTGSAKIADGAKLVGIDVRPADGKLYGMTVDGTIVTVDAKTGKWEKKSQISEKLPAGATFSVDLARPKSITFTSPSYETRMFCGLTSRCTSPISFSSSSRLRCA